MSTGVKVEIAKLLVSGVKPVQVANKLNVSASYISQLAEDEEFQELFKELHAQRLDDRKEMITRQATIDDYIQRAELRTIERIYENIDLITVKPERAMRMFQTLNGAKRRYHDSEFEQKSNDSDVKLVALELPEHIRGLAQKVNVQKNKNNEVIEVEGRTMQTMPTAKLFRDMEEGRIDKQLEDDRKSTKMKDEAMPEEVSPEDL